MRRIHKIKHGQHGTHGAQKIGSFGKWSPCEHRRFLEAMEKFGNSWKSVKEYVGTRTPAQIRSHAQKYYKHLRQQKIKAIKSNPGTKSAVFVVTREYINRNVVPAKTASTIILDVEAKKAPASDPNEPSILPTSSAELSKNTNYSANTLLGTSIVVPLPCYPVYPHPMPLNLSQPEYLGVLIKHFRSKQKASASLYFE